MAKRIEALHGSYGVQSRRDGAQGSLFWFQIPYRPDEEYALIHNEKKDHPFMGGAFVDLPIPMHGLCPMHHQHHSAGSDAKPLPPIKLSWDILLVDDSPSIIKMTSMILKRQGHQITIAENGDIALRKIIEKRKQQQLQSQLQVTITAEEKQHESSSPVSIKRATLGGGKGFDLILMDLQMPIMDGLEATRRLRAMEKEEEEKEEVEAVGKHEKRRIHHPIIGMSANSDNETVHEALASGMDDFIAKPFSIEAFSQIGARYVQQ